MPKDVYVYVWSNRLRGLFALTSIIPVRNYHGNYGNYFKSPADQEPID